MLEVMRDEFKLDTATMHREIKGMHNTTIKTLSIKGIPYAELKSALIPATDRHEAGFIFDSRAIESNWYGREIMNFILPLLDKRTPQSVLCGDLLAKDQKLIFHVLTEFLIQAKTYEFIHGTLLYCVYLNNLTDKVIHELHRNLSKHTAYLGYIPATYQTFAKTYLSTTLVRSFLKFKNIVLMGHEDDVSNNENVNMAGFSFEEFGYQIRSIQSTYFGLFLSFKVERAVYQGFEVDTMMSLNAITQNFDSLQKCNVELAEAKYEYLKTKKLGKLKKAGIEHLTLNQLTELLKRQLSSSYIYNLIYLEEHNVVKFNLIIEVPQRDNGYPTRFTAVLEYKCLDNSLRVITLT